MRPKLCEEALRLGRILAALGFDTGSRIEFVETEKGQYAIVAATSPVQALKGMLRKPPRPVSIDAMNKALR